MLATGYDMVLLSTSQILVHTYLANPPYHRLWFRFTSL